MNKPDDMTTTTTEQADAEDDDYSTPIQLPDGRVAKMRQRDLRDDDLVVFDPPGAFASVVLAQRKLDEEIAAAGGLEACRAALATPPAAPADDSLSLNPDYLSTGQFSVGELAALKASADTATMLLSPRALADYVSKAVVANDGEPFDEGEIWAIVIEACAETGAAPPQAPADERERGRQQGILQERALWELAAEGQAIEAVQAEPPSGEKQLIQAAELLIRRAEEPAASVSKAYLAWLAVFPVVDDAEPVVQAEPPKPVARQLTEHDLALAAQRGLNKWGEAIGGQEHEYIAAEIYALIASAVEPVTAASEPEPLMSQIESPFNACMHREYCKGLKRAASEPAEPSELRAAAEALVQRWDSPNWKMVEHTGVFIDRLRKAVLAGPEPVRAEPGHATKPHDGQDSFDAWRQA